MTTINDINLRAPRASVVMITYKHEAFVAQAIEGVLMQKVNFDVELIISDDNSPDNTESVISNIIKTHPKGHWIKYTKHRKNKGMMPNFIWTLKQCRGKYIALCEGDDYWNDPFKLQRQVDFLEKNKSYSICFHDCNIVNENDVQIVSSKLKKLNINQQVFSPQELKKGPTLPSLTLMFRNVISDFPDFLSLVKNGDTSLISYLGMYGSGVYVRGIKPASYRLHGQGVWSNINQKEKYFNRSKTFFFLRKLHKNDPIIKHYFEKRTLKALSFSLFLSLDEKNYEEYFKRISILLYRSIVLNNFKECKVHFNKVWSAYVYPKFYHE